MVSMERVSHPRGGDSENPTSSIAAVTSWCLSLARGRQLGASLARGLCPLSIPSCHFLYPTLCWRSVKNDRPSETAVMVMGTLVDDEWRYKASKVKRWVWTSKGTSSSVRRWMAAHCVSSTGVIEPSLQLCYPAEAEREAWSSVKDFGSFGKHTLCQESSSPPHLKAGSVYAAPPWAPLCFTCRQWMFWQWLLSESALPVCTQLRNISVWLWVVLPKQDNDKLA